MVHRHAEPKELTNNKRCSDNRREDREWNDPAVPLLGQRMLVRSIEHEKHAVLHLQEQKVSR